MSYTPTTWAAGDTVTAAKLNKLEQGVASGGGVLVVGVTASGGFATCDKTCKEMWDAMKTGTVVLDIGTSLNTVVSAINDNGYTFTAYGGVSFNGREDGEYPKASLS